MICSATAFHSPDHLVVAVLDLRPEPRPLGLGQVAAARPERPAVRRGRADADGVDVARRAGRACCRADLGERPRFGADERPASPHILLVHRRRRAAARQPRRAPDGVHGVTVLDLPARWDELEDSTRLRLQFEGDAELRATAATPSRRCGCARRRSRRQGRPVLAGAPPRRSRGGSPRCTRSAARSTAAARRSRRRRLHGAARARRRAHASTPTQAWRQRPARDRLRVPIGTGDGGAVVTPRHQGVRPAGHGPARAGDRRDRLRQVGVPAHAGARPGDDALARAPQPGARRLQGRRDVRRHVRAAARLRGDHQPRPGAHPRRPHAGRAVRRDGAPPGAAARGRQLRLDPRLREGPRAGGVEAPALSRCRRCSSWSTSSPRCSSAKPEFIDLFVAIGRLGRSLGLHLLLASQRLEEGRLRGLESHLSYRVGLRTFSAQESRAVLGVPDAYELPAGPGPGLPQAGPHHDGAVQGGVRLRAAVRPGAGTPRRGRQARRASCRSRSRRCRSSTSRSTSRSPSRTPGRAPATRSRCSTSRSTTWSATARRRTRSGCRRSTCRTPSTS